MEIYDLNIFVIIIIVIFHFGSWLGVGCAPVFVWELCGGAVAVEQCASIPTGDCREAASVPAFVFGVLGREVDVQIRRCILSSVFSLGSAVGVTSS